jgi:hypothetical protein
MSFYSEAKNDNIMTLTNDGKVGIGTTSPDAKLQVSAGEADSPPIMHITRTNKGDSALRFSTPSSGGEFSVESWDILVSDGNDDLSFLTSSGLVMQLDKVGNLQVTGNITATGNITSHGTKPFVQDHPTDPTKEIIYISLEGGEAGTYMRGTWKLDNGKAVIELPEHFSMVTSEDGLTVQLTPRGEWLQLYVVQVDTKQIVVQEAQGKSGQFDYHIQGVRKGYEHHEVIQEKK